MASTQKDMNKQSGKKQVYNRAPLDSEYDIVWKDEAEEAQYNDLLSLPGDQKLKVKKSNDANDANTT